MLAWLLVLHGPRCTLKQSYFTVALKRLGSVLSSFLTATNLLSLDMEKHPLRCPFCRRTVLLISGNCTSKYACFGLWMTADSPLEVPAFLQALVSHTVARYCFHGLISCICFTSCFFLLLHGLCSQPQKVYIWYNPQIWWLRWILQASVSAESLVRVWMSCSIVEQYGSKSSLLVLSWLLMASKRNCCCCSMYLACRQPFQLSLSLRFLSILLYLILSCTSLYVQFMWVNFIHLSSFMVLLCHLCVCRTDEYPKVKWILLHICLLSAWHTLRLQSRHFLLCFMYPWFGILFRHEPPVTAQKVKIIHNDDDMVVVDKPSSIPVSSLA